VQKNGKCERTPDLHPLQSTPYIAKSYAKPFETFQTVKQMKNIKSP
jgi:hypothetical protein